MIADPLYPECIIYTVQKKKKKKMELEAYELCAFCRLVIELCPRKVANFQKDLAKSVSFNRQSHQ